MSASLTIATLQNTCVCLRMMPDRAPYNTFRMKYATVCLLLIMSCGCHAQDIKQNQARDHYRNIPSPKPGADTATSRMPVVKPDTRHLDDMPVARPDSMHKDRMPVVKPPTNIHPK